ncbi:MAG: YncE family protein [Terriglobia bacterium]
MDFLRRHRWIKQTGWFLAVLLMGGAGRLSAQQIPLPLASGPFDVAVVPETGIAVVTNRNSNTASIIDLNTSTIKATLAVGLAPTGVAINPVTNRAVVANFGDDTVTVIDITSLTVVATVLVGAKSTTDPTFHYSPRAVAIDTANNQAIVANLNGGGISVIDLNSNTSVLPDQLQAGTSPIGIAYYQPKGYALVINYASNDVTVIDVPNRVLIRAIPAGTNPVDISLNLTTNKAYVANSNSSNVSIIDLDKILPITGTPLETPISLGFRPSAIGVNPVTNVAAVTSADTPTMSLINLSTNSSYPTVINKNVGTTPSNVTVNSANNTALVTSPNDDVLFVNSMGFVNYLPFAIDNDTYRSNVGLTNISSIEANFQLEILDKDGKSLGKGTTKVAANGFLQINNINRYILGTTNVTNTVGYLRVTADQPFSSFLSLINNISNDPAILIGRSVGYASLVLDAVTNAGSFVSKLVILNLGNAIGATTLTARNPDTGEVLATKSDIFVPVGGFYLSEDILADMGLTGKFGPLYITSPNLQPLIVDTLVLSTNNTGGFLEAVGIQ